MRIVAFVFLCLLTPARADPCDDVRRVVQGLTATERERLADDLKLTEQQKNAARACLHNKRPGFHRS